jgi:hypothetical protein
MIYERFAKIAHSLSLVNGPLARVPGHVEQDVTALGQAELSAVRREWLERVQVDAVGNVHDLEPLQLAFAEMGSHPTTGSGDDHIARAAKMGQALAEAAAKIAIADYLAEAAFD